MIKSLIIIVLLLVLVAGAFLSRPSPESLKSYLQQKTAVTSSGGGSSSAGGFIQNILSDSQLDAYVKSCTFRDRLLWMDVQRNGQTVYTGAFAHWWQRGSSETTPPPKAHSSRG